MERHDTTHCTTLTRTYAFLAMAMQAKTNERTNDGEGRKNQRNRREIERKEGNIE